MAAFHERVRESLPRLTAENYRESSAATWDYNCIAWAVGVTDAWWWPAAGRYWPPTVPREETVAAFRALFAALGYILEGSSDLEPFAVARSTGVSPVPPWPDAQARRPCYERVQSALEPGVEKVALYAVGDKPTHAARQLPSGSWTSKLGPAIDIEHTSPDAVSGGVYGDVVAVLRRNRTS